MKKLPFDLAEALKDCKTMDDLMGDNGVIKNLIKHLVENILKEEIICREFWRSIARLGGFIGKKSDGDPEWQTLWKGWMRFLDMLMAVEALKKYESPPNETSYFYNLWSSWMGILDMFTSRKELERCG